MTILQEIFAWSNGLPVWQQDALRRLYGERQLTAQDLDDLYALAKSETGIPDAEQRTPQPLAGSIIGTSPQPARKVVLHAIKDLANVNALADGMSLPIAPVGLTIIYGENGAGKSGYSRVLKHACRARDRKERILANAALEPGTTGTPSAVFDVEIDGVQQDLSWRYGEPAPEPLADLSIFDTSCATAYIDNSGDFAYLPYGLDILEALANLCNVLKLRASQEIESKRPKDAFYAELAKAPTAVGKALLAIPAQTRAHHIEALAQLSPTDTERMSILSKALNEPDPKQKAQQLRQKAARFDALRVKTHATIGLVNDAKIAVLRGLVETAKGAKAAAALAAKNFEETPGQLPSTGGEEWKTLFLAARAYAVVSCPDHSLSDLSAGDLCPLCQNPLGDEGQQRLRRFDTFVEQEVEKAAVVARSSAATAYRDFQQASINLDFQGPLAEELTELDSGLAARFATLQTVLAARKVGVEQAAGDKSPWDAVPVLVDDPRDALTQVIVRLQAEAQALDATANEAAKLAMRTEWVELDTRAKLHLIKPAVLEVIAAHELCQKLQACVASMATAAISRKSTQLSQTMASQELADALNEELQQLKGHELRVAMKPASAGGRTVYKLVLELPGGGSPSAILSEGEQRAIAIASFMAEVRLSKGQGGVVFDDPVSSLDHRRRWEVAERLANESLDRQVIIFTHDIYFLCILEQKMEALGATPKKNYIRRTSRGFGVYSEELPFDVLKTKDRVGRLRQLQIRVAAAHKSGEEDECRQLTSLCYGRLRLAWERAVEEVLFNGVVQRFGEGISTQKLRSVVVTDDDYRTVDAGMTKSSKFEHDAAMAVDRLPMPHPDELLADINQLETWRAATAKRLDEVLRIRA